MTRKLKRAVADQKQQSQQVIHRISGILGIPINSARTVEVPNRKAFVYVRLRNNQSEVIQAYNNQVAPSYNLPVLVERHGNRYEVIGVDTQRYDNNWTSFAPFLPRHGNTHSHNSEGGGGADVVWVYPKQFMPLLTIPSGSVGGPNVVVSPYLLKNQDGTWRYTGNTGTANFSQYLPTNTGAIMALVYLDTVSGNPYFLVGSGSVFSAGLTGSNQIYPYIPQSVNPTWIPDAAIRLVSGTSTIGWDNIYDVRQFLQIVPTGTGGGLSSVAIQDEGAAQGNVATLNFVGDGVSATVSGTVARINITNSGSSFTGNPSSAVLTNASGTLFTPTWLKWGTSVDEFIEFGADNATKEANAGKMGYGAFDPRYLTIIGAGTGTPRELQLLDRVNTEYVETRFINIGEGSTYNINGVPHRHEPNGFLAQDEGSPLGTGITLNSVSNAAILSLSGTVARLLIHDDGWNDAPGTWSFLSADAPSYVVSVNANITGTVGVGMKTQFQHLSQIKNFVVTAVSITGSTSYLNLYGGTNYTLTTGAITSPLYSQSRTPFGFPADPDNWTVTLISNTSGTAQASPTTNVWYNIGGLSGTIPVGAWRTYIEVAEEVVATLAAATNVGYRVTLSTSSSAESDTDFTSVKTSAMPIITGGTDRTSFHREKILNLATKTLYFLNGLTGATAATSISFRGDVIKTIVKCVCAYL